MTTKLRANLAEQLENVKSSEFVDIILELHPPAESAAEAAPIGKSRQEKIAAKKEAFTRTAASVEDAVRRAGGEVTGLAWINHTLRARVPAENVRGLCEHEQVSALDTPHPLKADYG